MKRQEIAIKDFLFDPAFFEKKWLLLTAGDFAPSEPGSGSLSGSGQSSGRPYNSMTISWGSVGQVWNKPFFQVFVRPTRFTYGFMNESEGFTLCAFPRQYKPALGLLGAKSGRDGDKIAESGLTPIASRLVSAPGYDEAELIVECRKMYWQDMDSSHFLDPTIETNYKSADYHRIFYGEILTVSGTDDYRKR